MFLMCSIASPRPVSSTWAAAVGASTANDRSESRVRTRFKTGFLSGWACLLRYERRRMGKLAYHQVSFGALALGGQHQPERVDEQHRRRHYRHHDEDRDREAPFVAARGLLRRQVGLEQHLPRGLDR